MKDLIKRWVLLKKEYPNCIPKSQFIADSFVLDFSIEKCFIPVYILNKKVQFTNVCFNQNSSGKDYFLILVGKTYKFLEFAYEPDCDGSYYTHYICDLFDVRNSDHYKCNEIYDKHIIEMLKTI